MYKDKVKYGLCLGVIVALLALSALTNEVVYSKLLVSFSIVVGCMIFFRLQIKTPDNQGKAQNTQLN